jgi:hypothetical protein
MDSLHQLIKREDYQKNDQNIGSARGTSTSAFVSTLVVNLVVFAVLILIFAVLRRSNRRIYAPRTYVSVPGRGVFGRVQVQVQVR